MTERGEKVSVKWGYLVLNWGFLLFLLFSATGFTAMAFNGQRYPDLSILPVVYGAIGLLCVLWLAQVNHQTTAVTLLDDYVVVKKFGRQSVRYPYSSILRHNERHDVSRGTPFAELTVYFADDWFSIRSYEFRAYACLKDHLTQYGQPVPYRSVLTLTERNRLRWSIGGLVLLIAGNIAFGFLAHNPADPNPARLVSITGDADKIRENRNKGRLKSVTISLRAFPGFAFIVSRRDYAVRLESLASAITPGRPVTLLIRQSDYRKKLRDMEPLTFGDKYIHYSRIMVFGVNQGDSVDIRTPDPVFEPTHTNPLLRTILFSFLLLLCWTGWVWVDQQAVLRTYPASQDVR